MTDVCLEIQFNGVKYTLSFLNVWNQIEHISEKRGEVLNSRRNVFKSRYNETQWSYLMKWQFSH